MDLGPAPAETKLGMSIRFSMTPAQDAALDQLLADQQNPSSPRYHQWLTTAQFAAQFGLSSPDIAKIAELPKAVTLSPSPALWHRPRRPLGPISAACR
jgi:subtilase family serine protease